MPMNNAMQPNAQMDTPSNALARRPAPTNSLRRLPPNLGAYVQQKTGLEQWRNDERLNLLPRRTASGEWLAPAMANELAKAALAPGYAMRGGQVTEEDALNFGLNFMGSGLGASAATKGVPRNALGMNAYHGSPHRFDKFDMSKIGTGEGAQAYGHGLYFAENPEVAGSYKNLIQRDPTRLTVDGAVVSPDTIYGRAAEDVARIGVKATLQKIDDNIRFNEKYAPDMAAHYKSLRTKIEGMDPARVNLKEGTLYHVEIPDEAVAQMLDWDAPLSQQPESVKTALNAVMGQNLDNESGWQKLSGEKLYRAVQELTAAPDKGAAASKLLAKHGIPGIRYLDAGSRDAGNGTRNIVVFDENLPKIIKRE